jgi:hypothetical protein
MEMLSLRQFKTWSCPGLSRLTDASAIDSCFSFQRHSSRSVFTPWNLPLYNYSRMQRRILQVARKHKRKGNVVRMKWLVPLWHV